MTVIDRPYSTLELVKFDETARVPELDHEATAFELDASVLAPQVSRGSYTKLYTHS